MQHLQRSNYGSPDRLRTLGELQVSATSYAGNSSLPWHEHDEAYLCLVASGTYTQQAREGDRECTSGLLLVHPQGHRHANRFAPAGARCLSIFVTDDLGDSRQRWLDDYRQLRLPNAARLLARIEGELAATDDAAPLALHAAVLDLVAQACRHVAGEQRPAWLQRVLERLHDDPLVTPSLRELGVLAGVHPAHLARSFQRVHGVSIGEYQRAQRINLASRALLDDERSIADVAIAAGFADQSHFARVFKRTTGETPRDYRRRLQRAS